jgi:hypothetical protein
MLLRKIAAGPARIKKKAPVMSLSFLLHDFAALLYCFQQYFTTKSLS